MKKALIVTIFKVPNFGSVLQAYATQSIIEHLGYDCHVLNYDHNKSEWAKKYGVKRVSIKYKIARLLGLKASHRKANLLDSFINKHFHLTRQYNCLSEIEQGEGDNYDVYIAGSDQIWNTKYTHCDPAFLLDFANAMKRRISIASSFACKNLDEKYVDHFQKQLSQFYAVSVREALGMDILINIGIEKAHLVLDPTLLLDARQWNVLRKKKDKPEKYILLYMWCYAFEPRPYIYEVLKYYKEQLQCKIIALEGFDKHDVYMKALDIEDATESSIPYFLDYFADASLVVTSSFHGTAFAVNYGVPLLSIVPNSSDDRQSSLLGQLGLDQCRLIVNERIDTAIPFYDKNAEQKKLQSLRDDSLNWIENVLK